MATINLFQLYATGSELFHDSESFLNELSDSDAIFQDQDTIVGGIFSISALTGAFVGTFAIGHGGYAAKSFSQPRSKYSHGFGW